MPQRVAAITLLVPSYDEGLAFFRDVLDFAVLEDRPLGASKRWVVVAPSRDDGAALVLAVANDESQRARIGDQTGGRVGFFLHATDFWKDYEAMCARGVRFLESPRRESYGLVAVFLDPWGGKWDLLQPADRRHPVRLTR
jgi:catechol 2,3-dioxygenase-like lactoylglutathione lyase family enzyme